MIREQKYLVIKYDDISKYLSDEEIIDFMGYINYITCRRETDNKTISNFVCVKDSMKIYEDVWKMVEGEVNESKL